MDSRWLVIEHYVKRVGLYGDTIYNYEWIRPFNTKIEAVEFLEYMQAESNAKRVTLEERPGFRETIAKLHKNHGETLKQL